MFHQNRQNEGIEPQKPVIEILELKDMTVRFLLSNCDVSVANALRRVMIAEVPTMAIHFVDMIENTSPIQDEMLAQRLGLVPLVSTLTEQKLYDWEVEGEAADDLKTRAIFTLKIKNYNDEPLEVTSKDLQAEYGSIGQDAIVPVKFYSAIFPQKEVGIPIVKLGKNQSVHLRCHALKGFGKMHAKWSPVNIATFKFEADLQIDQSLELQLTEQEKKDIVGSCPTKVFDLNSKSGRLEIVNPSECVFCEECQRSAESIKKPRLIKVGTRPNKYLFYVESAGQLKAAEIVQKGLACLRNKLENLNSEFQATLNQKKNY